MKKRIIIIISSVIATFVLVTSIVSLLYFALPPVYGETWEKGFTIQYKAIKNSNKNERKIIIFGGSYVAYSIDNKLIKEKTGIKTYTLGNDRGIGINYPIEIIEANVNKDDIIIYPFDDFSEGDYGMDLLYAVWDGESDMFWDFARKHPDYIIKSFAKGAYTKSFYPIHVKIKGTIQSSMGWVDDDSMLSKWFDKENGQYTYERKEIRIKESDYNSIVSCKIENVNDYAIKRLQQLKNKCEEVGAKLYLTMPATYEKSIIDSSEELSNYGIELSHKIGAPLLGDFNESKCPYDYMFDGPFHLNDMGAQHYSNIIANNINLIK